MLSPTFKISIKGSIHLDKQTTFALATTLTEVALRTRGAAIDAIEDNFTLRTTWHKTGPFAVKVKAATKQNLTATVGTAAPWLSKFLRGSPGGIVVNLPRGRYLAVPTINVKRTKRDSIKRGQRPRDFMGKSDVLLPLKSGKGFVLFQYVKGRPGRGVFASRMGNRSGRLVAMYILTPAAKIRQRDIFLGPARRIVEKHWANIFEAKLKRAFRTARG